MGIAGHNDAIVPIYDVFICVSLADCTDLLDDRGIVLGPLAKD